MCGCDFINCLSIIGVTCCWYLRRKEVLKTMSGLGESLENKWFDKGFNDGFGKGLDSGKLIQLIELVQSGDLTEERAAQKAGMTLEEFREKMQKETIKDHSQA